MDYMQQLGIVRRRYKDFVNHWNFRLLPHLHPGQYIIVKECSHIAERSIERNVNETLVMKLVAYTLEHYMGQLLFTGNVGVRYHDNTGIILSCVKKDGPWQPEYYIRINTVINSTRLAADRYIDVGLSDIMGYIMPVVTVRKSRVLNFDKQIADATQRLHNWVDSQ